MSNLSQIDIKVEVKEESCFGDFCSQNEVQPSIISRDKIKSETVASASDCDINVEMGMEETVIPSLCLTEQRECSSGDPEMRFNSSNKDGEIEPKIEIKEEQVWLERNSVEAAHSFDGIKDGVKEEFYSIESQSLHKGCVPSYTSDLFLNEDLEHDVFFHVTKDISECENGRKCRNKNNDHTYASGIQACVSSESTDVGESVIMDFYFPQNKILQQNDINKKDINEDDCVLNYEYNCDICEKYFIQSSYLKRHKLIHNAKEAHTCDICGKRYKYLSRLKNHKLIHKCKESNSCDVPKNSFNHTSYLKKHQLIHERKKPHRCEVCDKTFVQLSSLKSHVLIHKGKRDYKCEHCGKNFGKMSGLKSHVLIHEGKRPFKCDVCDKAFTQIGHLKTHKLMHEGKRGYKCDVCDKAFTRLSHMKRHKLIHEGKRFFKCDICYKAFNVFST